MGDGGQNDGVDSPLLGGVCECVCGESQLPLNIDWCLRLLFLEGSVDFVSPKVLYEGCWMLDVPVPGRTE